MSIQKILVSDIEVAGRLFSLLGDIYFNHFFWFLFGEHQRGKLLCGWNHFVLDQYIFELFFRVVIKLSRKKYTIFVKLLNSIPLFSSSAKKQYNSFTFYSKGAFTVRAESKFLYIFRTEIHPRILAIPRLCQNAQIAWHPKHLSNWKKKGSLRRREAFEYSESLSHHR